MRSKCGSFCMVHSINILNLVCGSLIALCMLSVCCCISFSFSLMNSIAKVGEPTGIPRRRYPWVSSTGIGWAGLDLFCLLE